MNNFNYKVKLLILCLGLTGQLNTGNGQSRMLKPITPPAPHEDTFAPAGAGAPTTPVITGVSTPKLPKTLQMALEHNIDINELPAETQAKFKDQILVKKFKQNNLYTAVKKGYEPNVAWLLEYGASALIHDKIPGHDALHISKNPKITALLITHGADASRLNSVCVIGCFAGRQCKHHISRTALEISRLRLEQEIADPRTKPHPHYTKEVLAENIAVLVATQSKK